MNGAICWTSFWSLVCFVGGNSSLRCGQTQWPRLSPVPVPAAGSSQCQHSSMLTGGWLLSIKSSWNQYCQVAPISWGGTWGAQSWGWWWCKYPFGASCCRRRITEHTFAEAKSIAVEIQTITALSHPAAASYPEQLAWGRPEECLWAQHWASLCNSKGSEARIWAKSGPCLYWWLCCPAGFGSRGWAAAGALMEPRRRHNHQRLHSVTFFKCWALSAVALCSFIILIDERGLWSIARMLLS